MYIHRSTLIFLLLLYACSLIACAQNKTNLNTDSRVHFEINPYDRKIVIPVKIEDSITANLIFDTGAPLGTCILDSTFFSQHFKTYQNSSTKNIINSSPWSSRIEQRKIYLSPFIVKMGNTHLRFNRFSIMNLKKYLNNNKIDGLFNIPEKDTTHIWEINFENNYLQVHKNNNFKYPNNIFYLHLFATGNYPFCINPSFSLYFNNDDCLILNRQLLVDSGAPNDIAIEENSKEGTLLKLKNEGVWNEFTDTYEIYYTAKKANMRNCTIDSLRIYIYPEANFDPPYYVGVAGINFLKRFNVFFDLKNMKLGLVPIKNFKRIVNPMYRRFHYSVSKNLDKYIINKVGKYDDNYYKKAGLEEGDEIVSINSENFKDLSREDRWGMEDENDTLHFNIIRKGKPMTIIVPVDKNEEKGD